MVFLMHWLPTTSKHYIPWHPPSTKGPKRAAFKPWVIHEPIAGDHRLCILTWPKQNTEKNDACVDVSQETPILFIFLPTFPTCSEKISRICYDWLVVLHLATFFIPGPQQKLQRTNNPPTYDLDFLIPIPSLQTKISTTPPSKHQPWRF